MTPFIGYITKTNFREGSVMFFMGGIAGAVMGIKENQRAFSELCSTLPKDQAYKLRAERSAKIKADAGHRKALEIARESRPLNFWGCR